MKNKLTQLKRLLQSYKKVLIAFSGGVDSSFLLKMAIDSLGKKNVFAVIAASETYTKSEKGDAIRFAKSLGANYKIINTKEFLDKNFKSNPKTRCYFCKKELFKSLQKTAKTRKINYVLDGSNKDDLSDYRPGAVAKKELSVLSPLQIAGFTKKDIRHYSKKLGLKTWNKPSCACLASRIPYGTEISKDILNKIEKSEEFLKKLGFLQVRVRHHDKTARIEIENKDLKKIVRFSDKIDSFIRNLGYNYVVLDLKGYRTGSMNEVLYG